MPSEGDPSVAARRDAKWAEDRAAQLAEFLNAHRTLSESLVKQFFIKDHWGNVVPAAWHAHLDALSMSDLANLLDSPAPPAGADWPLSLRAFFATCHALRLPGQLQPRGVGIGSTAAHTPKKGKRVGGPISARGRCAEEESLSDALRDSVKPKKMHEIVHLSALIDAVGRGGECARIVDVGSGLGYLSRSLAFQYNWQVIGVEGSIAMVEEAWRIDDKVERKLRKRMQDERPVEWRPGEGSLRHVAAHLPSDCTPERFWEVVAAARRGPRRPAGRPVRDGGVAEVEEATPQPVAVEEEEKAAVAAAAAAAEEEELEQQRRAEEEEAAAAAASQQRVRAGGASALVGLHTCGDLAPTMLRVFHHAGEAVGALVNVGCCYMKLSEEGAGGTEVKGFRQGGGEADGGKEGTEETEEEEVGFPMSQHVRRLGVRVGYKMGEHACHSLTAYATRLRRAANDAVGGEASLRLHGRRAVLELLLARRRDAASGGGGGRGRDTASVLEEEEEGEEAAAAEEAAAGAAAGAPAAAAPAKQTWLSGEEQQQQRSLRRRPGGGENAGVANLKGASTMSFEAYVNESFARCGLAPLSESEWEESREECDALNSHWNRVVAFFVLRLLLAPLWEALILLDRLVFLRELGYSASLVPLFDPGLSPRSYALVASKHARGVAAPLPLAGAKAATAEEEAEGQAGLDSSRCWGCLPEDLEEAAAERWARDAV